VPAEERPVINDTTRGEAAGTREGGIWFSRRCPAAPRSVEESGSCNRLSSHLELVRNALNCDSWARSMMVRPWFTALEGVRGPSCGSRSENGVQFLGLQMSVATQHFPILVAGHQRDLFNREARFE
jgi:hypothetical protein